MRMADRIRELDNHVLGRAVPDARPMAEPLTRPRPAVWSRRGRAVLAVVLIGMFADSRWGGDGVMGMVGLVVLFAIALVAVAADERLRSRRFYGKDEE